MKADAVGLACRAGAPWPREGLGSSVSRDSVVMEGYKGGPAEARAYLAERGILIVYKIKFEFKIDCNVGSLSPERPFLSWLSLSGYV